MSTVYRLKASEIDHHFLQEIQAKFGDKEIEIVFQSLMKQIIFSSQKATKIDC